MPPVTVRPLRPDDAERLGALTVDAYLAAGVVGPGDDYLPTLRDVAGRLPSSIVLGAYRGPAVVGGITLAAPGGPYAEVALEGEIELRMLAVDTAQQRTGVADALLRASAETAAELGHDALVLSAVSDSPGRRLYERLGFERVPDRDWLGDWDADALAAGTAERMRVYRLGVR